MQLYRIYLEKTAPDKAGPSVPEAGGGSLCWPLRENAGGLELLAAVAWRDTPEGAAGRFLAGRGLTGRVTETEEVPPGGVRALWERADEGVRPPWAALDGQLRLDDLRELAASGGAGWLPLDPSLSRQELAARCERELLPDLEAELERIFSRDTPVFLGHPVHYILEDDGLSDVNETAGLLLSALRRQGRLPGGPVLWLDPYRNYSARSLEFLYRMQQGSALMVRLAELTELERSFDEDWRFNLRRITELAQRYRDSVLTVFTLPASLREPMEHLRQRCGELAFVWLGRGWRTCWRASMPPAPGQDCGRPLTAGGTASCGRRCTRTTGMRCLRLLPGVPAEVSPTKGRGKCAALPHRKPRGIGSLLPQGQFPLQGKGEVSLA